MDSSQHSQLCIFNSILLTLSVVQGRSAAIATFRRVPTGFRNELSVRIVRRVPRVPRVPSTHLQQKQSLLLFQCCGALDNLTSFHLLPSTAPQDNKPFRDGDAEMLRCSAPKNSWSFPEFLRFARDIALTPLFPI